MLRHAVCQRWIKFPKLGGVRLFSLFWLAGAGLAWAQDLPVPKESQVKAVLLYNFASYTTWPDSAFSDGKAPFRLCVFGADPFRQALDMAVENESVQGHRVIVQRVNELRELSFCHILYFNPAEKNRQSEVLANTQQHPILTVGDDQDFIQQGGMVQFYNQGNKIRFAVDPEAVSAAGLKISANLLYIARIERRIK